MKNYVIGRLLDALAQLHYPKDQYEIQVLDDSTDETRTLIDEKAAALRIQGIDIKVVHWENRKGFKAGALQAGLPIVKVS